MGCCGSGSTAQTVAQANRGAVMPPGYAQHLAVVIGEDDGSEPLQVRAAKPVGGLRVQQKAWVTGSDVPALLESGDLIDVTGIRQAGRMYRVGEFTYSDAAEARRVAAASGQPVIEVA